MSGSKGNIFSKVARWVGGSILGLVVALPFALYIPWVQNWIADIACDKASDKTGMDISVGHVNIDFPLDITINDAQVISAEGDTLFRADEVKADVAVKPILDKKIQVDSASLKNAKSQIKTEDGSMDLDVDLNDAKMKGVSVDLNSNAVDLADASLKGGNAKLSYKPENKKPDEDKEESKPWKINARKVTIDDVDYKMDMRPTVDKLDAHLGHAEVNDVKVNTGEKTVNVGGLSIDKADVKYEYPSEKDAKRYRKEHPLPADIDHDDDDEGPWSIKADSLRLTNSHATYAQTDKTPGKPGGDLDMEYIDVDDINLAVDDFESKGSDLTVPLKHISGKERCGLEIKDGSGTMRMNDRGIDLDNVRLKTKGSDIKLNAHVDQDLLDGKPNGKANIDTDSKIDLKEVEKLVPEARSALKDIPHNRPVTIKAKARGNTKRLDVQSLDADIPGIGRVRGKGTIYNPTDIDRMKADLDTKIDLRDPSILNKMLGLNGVKLPPMTLSGKISKDGCKYVAKNLRVSTGGGTMRADGYYDMCNENYDVDADFSNFPVKSFLPDYDVRGLTASVNARGHGFDFTDCGSTWTDATVNLASVRYNGTHYGNIRARGKLDSGRADVYASSGNRGCDLTADAHGTTCNDHYVFTANADIRDLDLKKLGMYDGNCNGSTNLRATGDINLRTQVWDADMKLTNVDWRLDSADLIADDARAILHSTPGLTCLTIENEDNYIHLNSPSSVMPLIEDFQNAFAEIQRQVDARWLDVERLKAPLPHFDLDMHMGADGLIQRYMQQNEMDFRHISCEMSRDSSLYLNGRAYGLSFGQTNIDSITVNAKELRDKYLVFNAHMGNRPGTWDDYAQVDVTGGVLGSTVDFFIDHHNIKGLTGYRLGCKATLDEDEVKMKLFGKDPVIGYRHWTFNEDNYVNVDYKTRMLDANLSLKSDSSKVELFAERLPGENSEMVHLDVDNLYLQEWTQIVPMLDETSGTLNAAMDINWDGANADGGGTLNIEKFVYNGKRVGDVVVNTDFDLDPSNATTRMTANLLFDGQEAITLQGSLNDPSAASPLNISGRFNRLPLSKANAFIPGDYIYMDGYAIGDVTVSGSMDAPLVNGYLSTDSATFSLPRYGSTLRFAPDRIPVEGNVISLNNFKLIGTNGNPVIINGFVDLRDMDNMLIDIKANGKKVQFMDSKQDDVTEIFGKGLVDISASVNSDARAMAVRADATLLPGSNITYVMKDDISQLSTQVDESMVTFTEFNAPDAGEKILVTAQGGSSALDIRANIDVQNGAKINAYLSEDGQNRANVDGSGRLRYSLDFAGKDNLTGTYTIESGNVRYTPPLISQKNFDITSGSYITWTGEMLNPQLSLKGTEKLKTSVKSDDEGSRIVEFLIDANIAGTLSNIDLNFDLSTESDLTVQNELQSMSDVQRSQAAINLLLYNTYSGTNSAGNINNMTATTALFTFLQSKLNSWAAQTLPGVDLSFGINQYQGAQNGTTTSYSYRLAKTLFNDRFKVVVGGEYSTASTNDEDIASNLINDVSLEYYLNARGSRYLKLFRHSSFENVLEGQITEMGVAYVLKRKLSSLKNLFSFKHSREYILRDSLERERKLQLELQEEALDAINDGSDVVEPHSDEQSAQQEPIDKATVNRKEDENEQ